MNNVNFVLEENQLTAEDFVRLKVATGFRTMKHQF